MNVLTKLFIAPFLLLVPHMAFGATAAEVLTQYLEARLQGRLETAQGLWERKEVRRSRAMGNRYAPVEAVYDDYLMWSASERQEFAQSHRFEIEELSADDQVSRFKVRWLSTDGQKNGPNHVYVVQNTESGLRVSTPLLHDAEAWTRRDGRFIRMYSQRLAKVNRAALNRWDHQIEKMMEWLQTPEAAKLRLERIKLEYFLYDKDEDLERITGDRNLKGYLPGTERILTRDIFDGPNVARALINLTLRKTPPAAQPHLQAALAAALGGNQELSNLVLLRRARGKILQGQKNLALALEGKDEELDAATVAALFVEAGPEKFFEIYRSFTGTRGEVRQAESGDVLATYLEALGRSHDDFEALLRERVGDFETPLRGGSEVWPTEIRNLQSLLRWTDPESDWALYGYDVDENYIITMGIRTSGIPKWMKAMADSVAALHDRPPPDIEVQDDSMRPSGDPPFVVLRFLPRINDNPEAYESSLFAEQFSTTLYGEDFFGLFVNSEEARLFDYRINKLIGEYSVDLATPGDLIYYDEEAGRLAFRLEKSTLVFPMTHYTVRTLIYTGE